MKLFIWGVTCRSDWMDLKTTAMGWTPALKVCDDLMNPSVFFGLAPFFFGNGRFRVRSSDLALSTSKTVVFSEKVHHFVTRIFGYFLNDIWLPWWIQSLWWIPSGCVLGGSIRPDRDPSIDDVVPSDKRSLGMFPDSGCFFKAKKRGRVIG